MTEERRNSDLVIGIKQGACVYSANPSIPLGKEIGRAKMVKYGDERKGYIVDENGEILSSGGATFYEIKEVDDTKFVKLFLEGVKQAAGLTKAGLDLFEVVYKELQNRTGEDRVDLNLFIAQEQIEGLHERQFQRGLKELLKKEFLFRSPSDGVFYVNIHFMFNGDRLAFVQSYRRKGTGLQKELNLGDKEQNTIEEKNNQ